MHMQSRERLVLRVTILPALASCKEDAERNLCLHVQGYTASPADCSLAPGAADSLSGLHPHIHQDSGER